MAIGVDESRRRQISSDREKPVGFGQRGSDRRKRSAVAQPGDHAWTRPVGPVHAQTPTLQGSMRGTHLVTLRSGMGIRRV